MESEDLPKKGPKRADPPPRPVEQLTNRPQLYGSDPTKHYVWVSEVNDPVINVGYYKTLGYKISQYDPGEAKPTLGYQEYQQGDPIKAFGHVLMECPLEHRKALDAEGQAQADRIENIIRNREIDPLSPEEKRAFSGITSVRMSQDDRKRWQF